MHYGARYYDPQIGRFISADTIVPNPADPQQLNRFSYVTNNPVRYTDPTGHSIDMPGDCGSGETWTGGVCMPNGGGGGASVGMDSVVTASRTGTSGWGRFISPKYWTGFAFDRLTGQDAADYIDLIAEESARAGVDPRLVLAIIRQESEGHQLVGPVSKVWDTGLMWLDASRLRRTSIGIASVQYDTFRTTIERHPDVFNSSEHDWGSLVFDNELSIQVAVWYVADLQDQVAMATDLRQGYAQEWSSTDLIAYGYNAGEDNLGHVLAGDEEWLTPRTSYVARIRDYFAWADGLLCNGQDWSCS